LLCDPLTFLNYRSLQCDTPCTGKLENLFASYLKANALLAAISKSNNEKNDYHGVSDLLSIFRVKPQNWRKNVKRDSKNIFLLFSLIIRFLPSVPTTAKHLIRLSEHLMCELYKLLTSKLCENLYFRFFHHAMGARRFSCQRV
jgi:hypothetical protein